MPSIKNTSKYLKPYVFHGVNVEEVGDEARGDCPFCGKEGKFSIAIATGQWQCKVCLSGSKKGGGNVHTFLKLLHEVCCKSIDEKAYKTLARSRKLLDPDTLKQWGVVQSVITGEWLVAGYGINGEINQLYRYTKLDGTMRLIATPRYESKGQVVGHGLHFHKGFTETVSKSETETIYVCEGPWDGMALWETMGKCRRFVDVLNPRAEEGLERTGVVSRSLLADSVVCAVPGSGVFNATWTPYFEGKTVILCYDSDHPRTQGGRTLLPTGYGGEKIASQVIATNVEEPATLQYISWGKEGYSPELPSGWDVRDQLTSSKAGDTETEQGRIKELEGLLRKIKPIPEDWIKGRGKEARKNGSTDLECLPCKSWKTLTNSWRKALKWTPGLDRGLSCMLSVIASTTRQGDQLWMKIISPPSSGKSVLCEAVSVSKKHVLAKSTIRGFHSGYQTDKEGKEDNSLIKILNGKTLVTKDGDTLLQSPNKSQILAEARDVYDRAARSHYRNKMSKDHEGLNITWLLCGTESLRELDSSELGERFLDCVIVDDMDEELENEIGWRVALRASREVSSEVNGQATKRESPEMTEAKQLTGGYIEYLCANAAELLEEVECDDDALRECQTLATFVAFLRSRPSSKQEEKAQRELSFRLISQHVRLAKCMAIVLNRPTVDQEVLSRVRQTSLDTARGRTLEIVRTLYEHPEGLAGSQLALHIQSTEDKTRPLLTFLRSIKAIELRQVPKTGLRKLMRWYLSDRMRRLYIAVVEPF